MNNWRKSLYGFIQRKLNPNYLSIANQEIKTFTEFLLDNKICKDKNHINNFENNSAYK